MINILFIHQSAEMYGSDKMLLILLSKIDRSKFHPVVVLPSHGPLKDALEKENVKVCVAPVLKLYRKMFTPKNIFLFFKEISKSIKILDSLNKEYKFDFVYSNTLAVLLGMIFAKRRKIKHIWHVHEIIVHPMIIAKIFPILLGKYSNRIICNSQATRLNLINRVKQLDSKIEVIYNGVEERSGKSTVQLKSKSDFGFQDSDIVITLIGRISRLKGHKLLLNTYIKYIDKLNVKLLFVGSPVPGQEYYQEEIQQIIHENNLSNNVKIIPFTEDLNAIWEVTDIAAVPSTEAESFGLVALEAMLAKKPVVASNHGGLTEIVVNNDTGFLFEPSNEEALYLAINKLIENPQMRSEFGRKGYQRASEKFSVSQYVTRIENIFLQL